MILHLLRREEVVGPRRMSIPHLLERYHLYFYQFASILSMDSFISSYCLKIPTNIPISFSHSILFYLSSMSRGLKVLTSSSIITCPQRRVYQISPKQPLPSLSMDLSQLPFAHLLVVLYHHSCGYCLDLSISLYLSIDGWISE